MIEAQKRLRRAILLNDVLLVERIVRNSPRLIRNPDFEDKSNTSLHLAAAHGFVDIVQQLIKAGHENLEISRNTDHDTPLIVATRHGHVEVGKILAEAFPRCIPYVNKLGQDALAFASLHPSSTALLPIFLNHEQCPSSPHAKDVDGNTALHHASASGSLKALRILLAAGANPLAKNNYDWTPLAYSQTVAAEVYFKNLVAEFERKKVEGARHGEEREKQRVAGLRLVNDEASKTPTRELDQDDLFDDAIRRPWSPERRRPATPGSGSRHEWMSP